MNLILHLLTVQRGYNNKPLKKTSGEFIYKESERPDYDEETSKANNSAAFHYFVFVAVCVASIFTSLHSGFLASTILVFGMFFLHKKLGCAALILIALWVAF